MANRRQESEVFDSLPHVKVASIYRDGYGMDALAERFYWAAPETLYDSVVYGRGMQRREAGLPPLRPPTRKTTIAVEEAIMAAAIDKGTINGAGKPFGASDDLVRTLFFERGLDYPRKGKADRRLSVLASYDARRIENGFPAITADGLQADVDAGMKIDGLAARYGMTPAAIRQRARTLGVDLFGRADRGAMLEAYEAGESVLSIAQRLGLSHAYVRDCLAGLGAFQPQRPLAITLPPVKVRGRLTAAQLREDLDAGLKVLEIAQRHGVSASAVRSTMSKRGWKARRPRTAPALEFARASA